MQTYEFHTTTENGLIRIPDEFRDKVGTNIKVTIVNEELFNINWNTLFPPLIDTKNWKFNREEANER